MTYYQSRMYSPISLAAYSIINEHKKRTGDLPTGLYFNKLMSIMNMELKEKGMDIHLSHCWYRWGDEVVRFNLQAPLRWNHEEALVTTVNWVGEAPRVFDDDRVWKTISHTSIELSDKYCREGGVVDAVDRVYANAPFQFQRNFRLCRDLIIDIKKNRNSQVKISKEMILPCINDACDSFPTDDFPEVSDYVKPFRIVSEYIIKDNNIFQLYELTEEFWTFFCYYLRLHPKGSENVKDETKEYWLSILDVEKQRYIDNLGDHILKISLVYPEILNFDSIRKIAECRKESMIEADGLIKDLSDDMNGFQEYLDALRVKEQ